MADIFDVIADGTRRDILQLLLDRASAGEHGGTSVSHIVSRLGISQPTVSKHLKVLRDAGLVSVREEGQHRYYSLSSAPLEAVDDWLVPFLINETDVEEDLDGDGGNHALPGRRGARRRGRRPRRRIGEARGRLGAQAARRVARRAGRQVPGVGARARRVSVGLPASCRS